MKQKRMLILAPAFKGRRGGVQTYTQTMVSALEHHPEVGEVLCLEWEGRPPLRWLKYARFIFAHLWKVWRFRPDVAMATHLHLARLFPIFCPFTPHRWTSLHGVECWEPGGFLDRMALAFSTRLLPVSQFTLKRLAAWHPAAERKATVLPNHLMCVPEIQMTRDETREKIGWPTDSLILITVARLEPSERPKGIETVIRAWRKTFEDKPGIEYRIIGEGSDRSHLEALIVEHDLQGQVHLMGALSDEELRWAYRGCDALVMPSSKEGFGLVFVEALAHGRPVLAGNRDGSVEAVLGGEVGVLVDPHSDQAVAEGLRTLVDRLENEDPEFEEEILRSKIIEAFGPEKLEARLGELFNLVDP